MYIRCGGTHTPEYRRYTANEPNALLNSYYESQRDALFLKFI